MCAAMTSRLVRQKIDIAINVLAQDRMRLVAKRAVSLNGNHSWKEQDPLKRALEIGN